MNYLKSRKIIIPGMMLMIIIITGLWFFIIYSQNSPLVLNAGKTIKERILVPDGYERIQYNKESFAEWLRNLALKKDGTPVKLHNGRNTIFQHKHAAVIDIDTGRKDLQQCADCIIKLRAEYLRGRKRFADLHFNFTSGDRSDWQRWANGWRPVVRGNRVTWRKSEQYDGSDASFRRWLDNVFYYAGTISISRDFEKVKDISRIRPGDFFVDAGSPGHAVLIVDVAEHVSSGEKIFLLAQGFMPAQDMHLLKNLVNSAISPWFSSRFGEVLSTPDWDFQAKHLRRLTE